MLNNHIGFTSETIEKMFLLGYDNGREIALHWSSVRVEKKSLKTSNASPVDETFSFERLFVIFITDAGHGTKSNRNSSICPEYHKSKRTMTENQN